MKTRSSCQGQFFCAKTKHNAWELRVTGEILDLQCADNRDGKVQAYLTLEQARELHDFLAEVLPVLEKG